MSFLGHQKVHSQKCSQISTLNQKIVQAKFLHFPRFQPKAPLARREPDYLHVKLGNSKEKKRCFCVVGIRTILILLF